MKEYIAPKITCVELRSEESISTGTVECIVGCCDKDQDGIYEYISPSASAV